ncbi:hypothetical protein K8R33_02980 [archaeon]|nr:hypothetical protein [archaeon]
MLEEEIEGFKLGRKICNDLIYDYLHKDYPKYLPGIHETRVDGINEFRDFWEGLGYLSAIFTNTIIHPRTMYEIFVLEK